MHENVCYAKDYSMVMHTGLSYHFVLNTLPFHDFISAWYSYDLNNLFYSAFCMDYYKDMYYTSKINLDNIQ